MNKNLTEFFNSQLDEHKRILKLCREYLSKDFLRIVDICIGSLKNNHKIFFFWKWRKCIRCPTFSN